MAKIWLRGDFLLNSQLPLCPPHRIISFNISKMVAYAKSKGVDGYPNMSYDCWRYMACNKMHVSPELADLYFNIACDSWQSAKLSPTVPEPNADQKPRRTVPLLAFAVFLFMQQANRISIRASMKGVERRPRSYSERETSAYLNRSSSFNGSVGMDNIETKVMEFVLTNLKSLLELATIYEGPVEDYHIPEPKRDILRLRSLIAFDLIFEGQFESQPLSILPFSAVINAECTEGTGLVTVRLLEDFIRKNLQADPFIIATAFYEAPRWVNERLSSGGFALKKQNSENGVSSSLADPSVACDDQADAVVAKNGAKIVHNAKIAPKSHKLVIVNCVHQQTVAKTGELLSDSVMHIGKCYGSHLYLLSPFKTVGIRRCRGTTFVLGPTANTVCLKNCYDCTFVGMCKRLFITDSQRCTFYVKTPSQPLIFGTANDELTFAPFCSWYGDLENHMAAAGINGRPDRWNEPLVFANCDQKRVVRASAACWRLMEPKDFYPVLIPFQTSGGTKTVPGGLPISYKRALEDRKALFNEWNEFTSRLNDDERLLLKELVEKEYSAWLVNTGRLEELDQLKLLDERQRRRKPK